MSAVTCPKHLADLKWWLKPGDILRIVRQDEGCGECASDRKAEAANEVAEERKLDFTDSVNGFGDPTLVCARCGSTDVGAARATTQGSFSHCFKCERDDAGLVEMGGQNDPRARLAWARSETVQLNSLLTLAFEVTHEGRQDALDHDSPDNPQGYTMPTLSQALSALQCRVADLLADPQEAREAILGDREDVFTA
jgi:hypothetical protein